MPSFAVPNDSLWGYAAVVTPHPPKKDTLGREEAGSEMQLTLLVCMPECAAAHTTIVSEMQQEAIDLVESKFVLSQSQALALVQLFASVRHRAGEGALQQLTAAPTEGYGTRVASGLPFLAHGRGYHRSQQRRWPDVLDLSSSREDARALSHATPQASPGESGRLLATILELAQRHRGPQHTTAHSSPPLENSPDSHSVSTPPLYPRMRSVRRRQYSGSALTVDPAPTERHPSHTAPSRYPRLRPGQLLLSPISGLPDIEFAASDVTADDDLNSITDPLMREHVRQLLLGGTVHVMLLRGLNAVQRLCKLAGPEDPLEARRVAPKSWSARYGIGAIRMGVYTPCSVVDARAAVHAVFGEDLTRYKLPSSRGKSALEERSPQCVVGSLVGLGTELSSPPLPAPLTFSRILPALRASVPPSLRMSYYTGLPPPAATAATSVSAPGMPGERLDISLSAPWVSVDGDVPLPSSLAAVGKEGEEEQKKKRGGEGEEEAADATSPSLFPYPLRRTRLSEFDDLLRGNAAGAVS